MNVFWGTLALCALLVAPAGSVAAFDHAALARRAVDQHILPRYEAFFNAAAALDRETAVLCAQPSGQLQRVRIAFREAAVAWARIEHIRFGPVAEKRRYDAMVFWPDQKGLGRRQVERLIASTEAIGAEDLEAKSVAVQGLTAFEIAVHGAGSDVLASEGAVGARRCGYAQGVARNVLRIARDVRDGWSAAGGYSRTWLDPGPDNPQYIEAKETTQALVQAYLFGLEQARNLRLAGPLGFRDPKARAMTPIYAASGGAAAIIAGNVDGIAGLLQECGFLDEAIVAGEGADGAIPVLRSLHTELARAGQSAEKAAKLGGDAFRPGEAQKLLVQIGFPLKNAYETGRIYLSQAAGLSLGFNSLDGD